MDLNFILKIAIGLLVIITFFQVIRLIELSSRLAENKDQVTDKSNFYNGLLLLLSGIGLLAFFFWQRAEWGHLTLQAPASEHGVLIDQLWHTTMGLIIVVFLVLQPDIGQTLLILFAWSILIFISGINLIFLITLFFILILSFSYLVLFVPKFAYIKSRIVSFFDSDTGTHNFQSDKAIESIVSGGFFGKGIGEGTLKNRVPEAHTDYIISVISEEFGIVAIILILFLFLVFIHTVFKKVNLENNDRSKLILVGCISLILMQVMIHVGVNIRLFPTTGMTLPFISYGGSSIVGMSIISGIILNLTRRKID